MSLARAGLSVESDAELAAGAADGDAASFRELYRRYASGVYRLLVRLVGPIAEVDDLVQQVFISLHRALPTFRNECELSTFVHKIVVHAAYDHLRRRAWRRALPLDHDVLDAMAAPGPTPEARAQVREELTALFRALARLKAKKRVAFVLVAIESLSLEEAAELVGAKPQAVKQRMLAARRELGAELARRGREPSW